MNKVISKVRVTEVDGLSDALVRLYKADEGVSSDAFLKSVMDEVEKLSVSITTAIKKDKVLSSLEEADGVRDEAVKNLSTLLDGYEVFPVAAKKEAAKKLKAVFDKYGKSITTANYVSESSLIESLLEDFSNEEETVGALDGIKEILEQIRSAQNAFVKASDEYNAASTVKTESASSLKKPLLSAINDKFIPYITAMQMANSAVYADFATKAGGEIKRVNEIVSRRGK
ncbi:DUF6261 family protein [uncultured Treponema sp.]|uniref:DUF6261 family protein n=1 Tax=uncultured Treponema sp. TaxID=162155 RepID=UPI0025E424DC|nr:DUF6261 family protein [uncultured Treponema sp.]